MSPALADRFLSTVPPRKSSILLLKKKALLFPWVLHGRRASGKRARDRNLFEAAPRSVASVIPASRSHRICGQHEEVGGDIRVLPPRLSG